MYSQGGGNQYPNGGGGGPVPAATNGPLGTGDRVSMVSQQDNVKIVINREERVVNHLTKEVNNNLNLMFYDFNDYG